MEKSSNGDNNDYSEEWKDIAAASLTIASFRQICLDKQTAKNLNKLKARFLGNLLPDHYNPQEIPRVPGLTGLIGRCSKPFQKLLTISDLRVDQSRLSLTKSDVEGLLLPLLNEDEDPVKGIPVDTYDSNGNKFPMTFKFWNSKYYVLTSGWTNFQQQNELEALKDSITVQMFRHEESGKLCFVITWRKLI